MFFFPANLSTEGHSSLLSEHPSGVYFGWAGLSTRGVYKMVMSIGWNPYFNNTKKTIVSALFALNHWWQPVQVLYLFFNFYLLYLILQEPWLLHEFSEDFYGEELRLVIVGYIRPEVSYSFIIQFAYVWSCVPGHTTLPFTNMLYNVTG